MAQVVNYVADFRAAVAAMIQAYNTAYALVDKADALGWDE